MTETAAFRFLIALLLVGFVAHRAYYTHKNPPTEDETVDRLQPGTASRLASILSVVALASTAIYIAFPGLIAWSSLPLPMWARWFGVSWRRRASFSSNGRIGPWAGNGAINRA